MADRRIRTVAAAARGDRAAVADSLAGRSDTPDFCAATIREAQYHSVLPLLAAEVRAVAPASRLMSGIRAALAEHMGQVLRLEALLADTVERLRQSGIPTACFKGAALAWRHYASPAERLYTDVDLLVRASDMAAADSVLRAAGLHAASFSPERLLASGYGEAMYSHRNGSPIDLHWHVMRERNVRAAFAVDTGEMLERAIEISVAGRPVPILDDEDMLIATATHACFDGGYRLGWLIDVSRMVEGDRIDASGLAVRCRDTRTAMPVQAVLDRAERALGTGVPRVMPRTAWLGILAAIERLRPVGSSYGRAGRGGVVFRATRPTLGGSIAALGGMTVTEVLAPVIRDPAHRWRIPPAERD